MKYNYLIIICLILGINSSCEKKDDIIEEPPSSFYPLSIGNIWSYKLDGWSKTTNIDCPCYETKGYITEKVIKDTLINNNQYYVLESIRRIEPSSPLENEVKYYIRYDDQELKAYTWDFNSMQEHLLVDFDKKINQSYNGYRLRRPSDYSYHVSTVMERKHDSLAFEQNRKILDFKESYYYAEGNYSFAENIGLINQFYLDEIGNYQIKLIGFKINNVVKGDISNVD